MHHFIALLLILLTSTIATGQSIIWDADRNLRWEDFQGPADASSRFHALTQSGVKYSYRWQSRGHNITYTFEVTAYYDKSLSWVKHNKATSALLRHEQLHFNISELFARKLKKTFLTSTFTRRHESEIEIIFVENQKAREQMQAQYDIDSEHMSNKQQQQKWENYIATALDELKEFSSPEVQN